MNYIKISKTDIANGIGVRVVLWLSGCSHHCRNCHNPETWNPAAGQKFDEKAKAELFDALSKNYVQGITFSGGDPMFCDNRPYVISLMREIRKTFPKKDIWLYTGYTFEEMMNDTEKNSMAQIVRENLCDVIVDGEFKQNLYSISLNWKGSANQRVIDVKESSKAGKPILLNE